MIRTYKLNYEKFYLCYIDQNENENDYDKATDNKNKKKLNIYARLSNCRVEKSFKTFS